jgi:hypothetical protein
MTVPAPVIVKIFPETVAGPDRTLKLTPNPELADAESEIGDTPYITGDAGGANVIDCGAWVIVTVIPALEGLFWLSPLYEAVTE